MPCHSQNVHEVAEEQLAKPIPATDETHVESRNHGLACTNRQSKDLLTKGGNISSSIDTKLTVSKGAKTVIATTNLTSHCSSPFLKITYLSVQKY